MEAAMTDFNNNNSNNFQFDPSNRATTSFRQTFNDWRVQPLHGLPGGGDVHATWKRNETDFHLTHRLPGDITIRDDFKF